MHENFLKRLIDSVASKTVLALIAIIGTGITIYAFLLEKKVNIRYEIIANTNVLDFNAEISKLEVLYDSTNLQLTNENLRIYTVKIINNGDKDILNNFYDPHEPLGIKISSGQIIEKPDIIESSNDYIRRNIKVIDYQKNKISFSQIILEPGEYFIVKLLVLHPKESTPSILAIGKIAGLKNILVVNAIDVKENSSFINSVFKGNLWVQLLRLIAYFFSGLIIIVIIVIISDNIDTIREKKKRIRIIDEFKAQKNYSYSKMDDAIFEHYKLNNHQAYSKMQQFIENEKILNEIYSNLTNNLSSKEYRKYRNTENQIASGHILVEEDFTIINKMLSDGIIFSENDRLVVNRAMRNTLKKFIYFLKDKGEIK